MLEKVDLSKSISKRDYEKELKKVQLRLVCLQQRIRTTNTPVLIGYEGWDASGKGGSILRIISALDPRGYSVYPIGAPSEEERKRHYLWRFWTRIPAGGQIAVFDRTWYGRVLVERVEGFASKPEWKRAYGEIVEFEETLVDSGVVLVKFWMQISKEEQLRRFQERQASPFKRWKISEDDWRNREKRDQYLKAAEDMLEKTAKSPAPWYLIAAEDKHYARIRTAQIVAESIEAKTGKVPDDECETQMEEEDGA